ncbi:hypothetical protein ABKN59_011401 [Abortiporus biennis]
MTPRFCKPQMHSIPNGDGFSSCIAAPSLHHSTNHDVCVSHKWVLYPPLWIFGRPRLSTLITHIHTMGLGNCGVV